MPAIRRPSILLAALLLVLAVGLGAAAWRFLRAPAAEGPDFGAPAVAGGGDAAAMAALERLDPALPAVPGEDGAPAAPATESERRAQASAAEAELREAVWLEGRVVFPADTPRGEVVDVVALGRKFKTRANYRARVESDGRFRVAFAPGTKSGRLDVDALHLFLDKPVTVRLEDGKALKETVLEPFLGGALRGQLRLSQGAAELGPELVGKTVRATAWSARWRNMVARTATVDRDLRFELRGLPPELGLNLEFDSNVVTKLAVSDLRAPAGETVERVFDLALGARVRGRVRSDAGLPKNVLLEARIKGGKRDDPGADRDTGKVADDGSFDLRGLKPGEITLTVSAPLRKTHKLELGRMEHGDVKEGVELVLGAGRCVAGRVVWPDRSPAVDAQVVVTGGGGDDDPLNPFDTRYSVRTNAAGEFLITGLNDGPYAVLAQAKAAAEEGKRRKGPTWKARIENVAADTRGMEIALVAGYSVEGIVLDDVGAPVTTFGVVATAKDEGKRSFNIARMVSGMFKPDDGRFELGGLLEGGYTLHLNVPGHDDPEPIDVTVPGDGATYTFVAPRRARIAGLVLKPDGSPAVRADVVVDGDQGQWSGGGEDKSDNHGRFEIKAAQTGKITITARLDGFAPSEPFETEIAGGQSLTDLRLALRVGGRITGEVLPSRAGERVDGRRVRATLEGGRNQSYDTTTDRAGKFELKAVAPGAYAVAADAAATEVDLLRDPDARRGNDWELIELTKKRGRTSVADGATAHIVLGAPPANPISISGRVHRGAAGAAGVRVVAQGEGEHGRDRRKAARTDGDGRYELIVDEPGGYQIQVHSTRGGTTLGKHVDVPAQGLGEVDFALPSGRIAGRVRGPDGEELEWVRVEIARLPQPGESGSEWSSGGTSTDRDGEFEFKDLPAGEFTLEVSGSSFNRRSFEQRQYGMVKQQVVLAEGQDRGDLDIRLITAGALEVAVLLADGTDAGNGKLTVRRTDAGVLAVDDSWFSEGKARRGDLEPGTYEVRVEVEGQVSPAAEVVTIVPSQTTSITVRLAQGGYVRFEAQDAQGQPIGAMATIFDRAGRPLLGGKPLRSGQQSSPLPPGEFKVVARDEQGRTRESNGEVASGETVIVRLTFE